MLPPHILQKLLPWQDQWQLNAMQIWNLEHKNMPVPHDKILFSYYCIAKCNQILHEYHKSIQQREKP